MYFFILLQEITQNRVHQLQANTNSNGYSPKEIKNNSNPNRDSPKDVKMKNYILKLKHN